ncbi:hypothetical protein JKP88DRAFT_293917 [Tribonema minus]|uniref:AAA+ ATPase domain-containing protein n=1 Tax=Tribonema minus TaxID=303371 RepID=A0A835ZP92_9STRA|nr:hypothetical protein JKP88DRAFT_293917 [Tribonema minus]
MPTLQQFQIQLVRVVEAAGRDGVLLPQVTQVVVVDGYPLNKQQYNFFGYAKLRGFIDDVPELMLWPNAADPSHVVMRGARRPVQAKKQPPPVNAFKEHSVASPPLQLTWLRQPAAPATADHFPSLPTHNAHADALQGDDQDNNTRTTLSAAVIDFSSVRTPAPSLFQVKGMLRSPPMTGAVIGNNQPTAAQWGLLGVLDGAKAGTWAAERVFMNTADPFCSVIVGSPNSGKSHTVATIAENCLIQCNGVAHTGGMKTATLVLHYDEDPHSECELLSLLRQRPQAASRDHAPHAANSHGYVGGAADSDGIGDTSSDAAAEGSSGSSGSGYAAPPPPLGLADAIVLVSPTAYLQRRAHYAQRGRVRVRPLLLDWSALAPRHVLALLNGGSSAQLEAPHAAAEFLQDCLRVELGLFEVQRGGLQQRLGLLETFVGGSRSNRELRKLAPMDLSLDALFQESQLVICDLTDPLLSPDDANCIFEVMLDQFSCVRAPQRKLAILDDAHKYLSTATTPSPCGLAAALVRAARHSRATDTRLVISTHAPAALAEETLSAATITLLHACVAREALAALSRALPLRPARHAEAAALAQGEALVFARGARLGGACAAPPPAAAAAAADAAAAAAAAAARGGGELPWHRLRVRRRLTGASAA